jgi:hypothetical protein
MPGSCNRTFFLPSLDKPFVSEVIKPDSDNTPVVKVVDDFGTAQGLPPSFWPDPWFFFRAEFAQNSIITVSRPTRLSKLDEEVALCQNWHYFRSLIGRGGCSAVRIYEEERGIWPRRRNHFWNT